MRIIARTQSGPDRSIIKLYYHISSLEKRAHAVHSFHLLVKKPSLFQDADICSIRFFPLSLMVAVYQGVMEPGSGTIISFRLLYNAKPGLKKKSSSSSVLVDSLHKPIHALIHTAAIDR